MPDSEITPASTFDARRPDLAPYGLNPDYASTLFRGAFGMTLGEYLLEYRIAHAQQMLA